MKRIGYLLALLFTFSGSVWAQNSLYRSVAPGYPGINYSVYLCTPSQTATQCEAAPSVAYYNEAGTSPITFPLTVSSSGIVQFYAAPASYQILYANADVSDAGNFFVPVQLWPCVSCNNNFTVSPTAPTPATADNSTTVATTAYVKSNLSGTPGISGATLGQPVIASTATSATSYPISINAASYTATGGDAATQINQACNALPAVGGVVDARGIPVPMYWNSNPFIGACQGKGVVRLLLPAGDVCYSQPIPTPNQRGFIEGVGSAPPQAATITGTVLIPKYSSGPYASRCSGSPFADYPTTNKAAVGGIFVTSYVGVNGTLTITTGSLVGTTLTIQASNTLPPNFIVGHYVYIGGLSVNACNGNMPIATVATTTNTNDTFTVTEVNPNCTGTPTFTSAFAAAANMVVGVYEGGLNNTNQVTTQFCGGNSFGRVWKDLTLTGNGIPNFTPYLNCTSQEHSIIENVQITQFTAAAAAWDSTFVSNSNAGGTHWAWKRGNIQTGNGAQNTAITQKQSITAITKNAGTTATGNYICVTVGAAFTVAPVVDSTVYVQGVNNAAVPDGYYQVGGAGMGLTNCNANPTTTAFALLAPGGTTGAPAAAGTVTLITVGRDIELYKVYNQSPGGGPEDCCWDTMTGGSSSSSDPKLFVGNYIDGTNSSGTLDREHLEQLWNGAFDVGEGDQLCSAGWCNQTGNVTVGLAIRDVDNGGSVAMQGPGWGAGTGCDAPSTVRFGPFSYGNTLDTSMLDFSAKNVFCDKQNGAFQVGSGTNFNLQVINYHQGQTWGAVQVSPVNNLGTTGGALTFDFSAASVQQVTLNANSTSTFNNLEAGERIEFIICQDATGNRTFAWPAAVHGGMTIGATVSKCSVQTFRVGADGATVYATSTGITNE